MRNKSAVQAKTDSLSLEEFNVLSNWSWPSSLPDNDDVGLRLLNLATASGQLTKASLEAATRTLIGEVQAMQSAYKSFVASAPAGLKDATGNLTEENRAVILGVLDANFGSVMTAETLAGALKQAIAGRQLRWKSAPDAPAQKAGDRLNALAGTGVAVNTGLKNHSASVETTEGNAWSEYLAQCPKGLLNADGDFDRGNYDRANEIVQSELGGKFTVATIKAAIQLMNNRKTLVWFEAPKTPTERAQELLAKQETEQAQKDFSNKHGSKTPQQVVQEAEKGAKEKIGQWYKGADSAMQVRIKRIVDADIAAKRSPLVSVHEISAMMSVYRAYQNVPGETHSQRDVVRDAISSIILAEEAYKASDSTDSACWTRIARRIDDLLETGVSGDVKTGMSFSRSVR